jgi:hypothetical protein
MILDMDELAILLMIAANYIPVKGDDPAIVAMHYKALTVVTLKDGKAEIKRTSLSIARH